jgi:anti-anti-sigma regulatory factor
MSFYSTETLHRVSEALTSNFGRGAAIIFDFSKTPFLSSSVIADLLLLRKRTAGSGAQMKLVFDMGKPGVQQFLDQTHLDRLFPVCGRVEEAIEAP